MTPRNIKISYAKDFFVSLRFFAAIQVIYFAYVTGSYALAMSIFSAASISQALLEIPTGIFSDKIGRRKTAVAAAFFGFLGVFFYALGVNYWFLLIGGIIEGLARALSSGNNDALVYDTLKDIGREQDYHKVIGKSGALFQLGFGIAAFIGGFVATASFEIAMWMSVVTQFIAFVFSLFIAEPASFSKQELNPYAHLKESIAAFRANPKLRLLVMGNTIKESIAESAHQFAPAFIRQLWPLWAIGILNTVTFFVSAIGYYVSDKIIGKLKAVKALFVGFIFDRVVKIAAFAFPTLFSPLLLASTSLTYGTSQVASNVLAQAEFSDHQRATMGSLTSIVMSVGFALASIAIGLLADMFGPRNILLVAEIALLPVLIIYWKLFKHK